MTLRPLARNGVTAGIALMLSGWCTSALASQQLGIYERILSASVNFAQANQALKTSFAQSHLALHGIDTIQVPHDVQDARVYILTSPTYEAAARAESPRTISAQILRVSVYTYGPDKKTYIDMANPVALAMIYYSGSQDYRRMIAAAEAVSREIIAAVDKVPGTPVAVQLAPLRSAHAYESYDGDGLGKMMAHWDNWKSSQETVFETKTDFAATVAGVAKALGAGTDPGAKEASGWRLIAQVPVGPNAVWFGIDNSYTQVRTVVIDSAFRSDGKTAQAPYPGVDHAPALPMEVLVVKDGKRARVIQYDEMWRMELYFWDAGYRAFARYAFIPPTIYHSIQATLQSARM